MAEKIGARSKLCALQRRGGAGGERKKKAFRCEKTLSLNPTKRKERVAFEDKRRLRNGRHQET